MCSFFFLRMTQPVSSETVSEANRFAKDRGPDSTGMLQFQDRAGYHCCFVHNLLDISGQAVQQPLVSGSAGDRTVLLFNGEIYNHRELHNSLADTECVLPVLGQSWELAASRLQGEYAIAIYQERQSLLKVLVDPFLTKPLFWGRSDKPGEFGVATCASSLRVAGLSNVQMVQPNSKSVIELLQTEVQITSGADVCQFSLRQDEASCDAWISSFIESVRRRATHGRQPICVFLSSGYDSGAICLALNLLKIPYTTLSIVGHESASILQERCRLNRQAVRAKSIRFDGLSGVQSAEITQDIQRHVEPFDYQHEDRPGYTLPVSQDGGAIGAWFLAQQARKNSLLVNLSGSGADEIVSDYGFAGRPMYHHSQFGGLFPTTLDGFFPWKKFYGDTQRSYLFKDEYILGRFGLEGRYPFLAHDVVQQFLHLTPQLKNSRYKAPVAVFLERYGYPFEESVKRGFSPARAEGRLGRMMRVLGFGGAR